MLVSDEALFIYATSARGVRLVETVPWGAEDFKKSVAKILTKDCKRRPVLILNDMVEQHYRKEKVLKRGVNMFDKVTMLNRKLHVAFPNYPIRAALQLNEKIKKTEKQAAADIYIFAAVPKTEQFRSAMQAAQDSLVSIAGFCLLPVEASDMVKTLSAKHTKRGHKKSVWSVFIGQHRSGSLRQIVTKNGELALTRMSPISEGATDPRNWANDVFLEFNATMSYLARFGYEEKDGLDVNIIAAPEAGQILRDQIEEPCNLNFMTVSEAAKALGVSVGYQEDQKMADALHVAWVGRKSKFILPMKAEEIESVSKPRKTAMLATLALVLGAGFLGYQSFTGASSLIEISGDIDTANTRKNQLDAQYQKELERKKELGFDVQLIQSSIGVFEELQRQQIPALDLSKKIGQALGKDLRLDKIDIKRAEPTLIDNFMGGMQPEETPLFELRMSMTYPSTTDIDQGNQEVNELKDRLAALLPDHKVEVTKLLKDYEYTENLVVETGDLEQENIQQDFVAEIMIQKSLSNKKEEGAQ